MSEGKNRFQQCATCYHSSLYWICEHVDNTKAEHWCPAGRYITWICEAGEDTVNDTLLNMKCDTWKKEPELDE